MNTHFASPQRAVDKVLQREVDLVSTNPIISGLLYTASGLIAVLNEHRQILSVNDTFLTLLGISNPDQVLGLRPGEAINCVHAGEMEGGCGTTRYCASCGAAIAIVASLEQDSTEERKCVVTAQKDGSIVDLCFSVRSSLVTFNNTRLVLVFFRDITDLERKSSIERSFFHDISNLVMALQGTADLLLFEKSGFSDTSYNYAKRIQQISSRLQSEIAIQRTIAQSQNHSYPLFAETLALNEIVNELHETIIKHPGAKLRTISFPDSFEPVDLHTDPSLLLRILTNMMINALEASEEGSTVKLWIEYCESAVAFNVWNHRYIPEDVSVRIFQHYFTTKIGSGRGIGTYTMKLFGEKFLKGKVTFTTSPTEGTTFRISVPVER